MKKTLSAFFIALVIVLGVGMLAHAALFNPGTSSSSGGSGGAATTTINGTQSASFTIQGSGSTTVSTVGSVITVNSTSSAGGGSGTVTTSSAVTTGYYPFFGSSNGLNGSSSVQNSSTMTTVGANTISDWFANVNNSGAQSNEVEDYLTATTEIVSGAASTSLEISTTTGLSPAGLVYINGQEIASYASFTSAGTSSTLNGVKRALFGTPVQTAASDPVWAIGYMLTQSSSTVPLYSVMCKTASLCYTSIEELPSTNALITTNNISANNLTQNGTQVALPNTNNNFSVSQSIGGTSSTVQLGTSANASHGCIELYDAVNSSTKMYIYSSSSVLVDTSTNPGFCL